ncbi:hypothetical protein HMPREF9056_00193 [Actinomyces sp. oral taxon 170 str. F0386]|nr:hypothetical protein HMPREF9056_00193 [Actinomyces sp. oral taxon 170 str. F0386]
MSYTRGICRTSCVGMCLETVMLWVGGNEGWDEGSARVRDAAGGLAASVVAVDSGARQWSVAGPRNRVGPGRVGRSGTDQYPQS